jgi:glycosyltransferase involved in cell wall biosynthesis
MLHCLGNSRWHKHVPVLTAQHGGVVLAHDVRMTALQCLIACDSPDLHHLSTVVWERHGRELGSEIRDMEVRSPIQESFLEIRARLESANAMLLGASVPGAQLVLVHSRLAARLASIDLRGSAPVVRVPFGHPFRSEIKRDPVRGRIASFGMVEPEKRPGVVVEALAYVRQRVPGATLRFVGAVGGGMQDLIESVASRVGVSGAITWTDEIDQRGYLTELAAADIAVQLRSVVNGESSGAIAECLSWGVPTVITNVGAHAELPSSAVVRTREACGAYELSLSVVDLLTSEIRKGELSEGGSSYARASSDEVVARALSDVLVDAPPPRGIG